MQCKSGNAHRRASVDQWHMQRLSTASGVYDESAAVESRPDLEKPLPR